MTQQLARIVLTCGAILVCASLTRGVHAQDYMNTYTRPTLSPYLALVPQASSNGGTTPPAPGTYQNYVRPMVDLQDNRFRQSIAAQNQPYVPSPLGPGYQAKNSQTTGISNSVRGTGHTSTFMNLSHYYPGAGAKPAHR